MDDESLGVNSVLPVADENDSNYELELPPADGLDYLRRVRLEAKDCPATVTVELQLPPQAEKLCVDDKRISRSSAIPSNHMPRCSPAPAGYAPSIQWQQKQEADFSAIRLRFCKEVAQLKKNKKLPSTKLPLATDAEGWCRFCLGNATDGNTEEGTPPLVSVIARLDQETLLLVLEYHIKWFEEKGFTRLQGQWFYALLTALGKPLLPESCSLIRSLARLCSNLRASLESADDSRLSQLNLLICLVGRYFNQTDLCDGGEEPPKSKKH